MFNVSRYLNKDNHIKNKDEDLLVSIIDVIDSQSGVRLDFTEIDIKKGKIFLICDNIKKTQILLFQEKIILEIEKKLNKSYLLI